MEKIKVLVAEDHPMYRDGLTNALNASSVIEVIAEASTGEEAIQQMHLHRPDVILMDINMPDYDGIETTRRIIETAQRANRPRPSILILTGDKDLTLLYAAMAAGADGYLLKGTDKLGLIRAIEAVMNGQTIFDAELKEIVKGSMNSGVSRTTYTLFPELSSSEIKLLALLLEGYLPDEIAPKLGVQEKTIQNKISLMCQKLKVRGRRALIEKAQERKGPATFG
ncbi:MAG: response regulator transcription factor [Anaerolineae bacterium]|nr:response regulator transcription factor [Anaerolineae bacterium]